MDNENLRENEDLRENEELDNNEDIKKGNNEAENINESTYIHADDNSGFSFKDFFKGFLWTFIPCLVANILLTIVGQVCIAFAVSLIFIIIGFTFWSKYRTDDRPLALGFLVGGICTLFSLFIFTGIGCGIVLNGI